MSRYYPQLRTIKLFVKHNNKLTFETFFLLRIRPISLFHFRIISEMMNHPQTVGLLGRVISSSQGLYLHRTTQHRQTKTNIHTFSGIRTWKQKLVTMVVEVTTMAMKVPHPTPSSNEFVRTPFVDRVCHEQ
jgi:hypothetical protein